MGNRTTRVLALVLACLLLTAALPVAGYANSNAEQVMYFDDGSYILVSICQDFSREAGKKTGTKTYTYRSNAGETLWVATLEGTFAYTGASSVCTNAFCDVTVYSGNWSTGNKTVQKQGNSAMAELTMVRKALNVTLKSVPVTMSLTCDADGNLS